MSNRASSNSESLSYPFETLLSASSIIFYHCDLKENLPILFISNNVRDILGFEAEVFEKDDQFWMERIHPDDRSKVVDLFENVIREESFKTEFRFRHADGHYIWLYDEVKLVRDEEGEPESVVGSSIEITERKKAEKKVRDSNLNLEKRIRERTEDLTTAYNRLRLLKMAIANINDMVIITEAPKDDPLNSEIVFVNEAFVKFTGYSEEEVTGKTPTFLHGPETSPEVLDYVRERIENHRPLRVEQVNYKKDGTTYWVELDMVPFPSEDDDNMYWVGINRNIDQRVESEMQLKREKRFNELAINSLPGLFYVIDEDFKFVRTNDNYLKELGYTDEELKDMTILDFYPDEEKERQAKLLKEALEIEQRSVVAQIKKKDGTVCHYLFNDKRFEQDGKTFIIGTGIDISSQVRAEEKLKESLTEKETLLAEIHHRVKNNLAVISGLLELQAFNEENQLVNKRLRESQARIQSIAMVHEKLYQSETLSKIELHSYVDELLDFLSGIFDRGGTDVQFKNNTDSVYLDVRQAVPCGLILNELITNAYKHAFEGQSEGTIEIDLQQAGKTVILEVKDDGIGIPEEIDQTSSESLGVSLVQNLVSQLKGELTIENSDGTTVTISFRLPDE